MSHLSILESVELALSRTHSLTRKLGRDSTLVDTLLQHHHALLHTPEQRAQIRSMFVSRGIPSEPRRHIEDDVQGNGMGMGMGNHGDGLGPPDVKRFTILQRSSSTVNRVFVSVSDKAFWVSSAWAQSHR